MKSSFFLSLIFVFSPLFVGAQEGYKIEDCQFQSTNDLFEEAAHYLATVANVDGFDPFFYETDPEVKKQQESSNRSTMASLLNSRQQWEESLPYASMIYEIRDKLLKNSYLKNFAKFDFFRLNMAPSNSCTFCLDGPTTLGINPLYAGAIYYRYGNTSDVLLQSIIGHEIGHFVESYAIWHFRPYKDIEEYRAVLNKKSNHLRVDAIGAILAGLSLGDLKLSLKNVSATFKPISNQNGDTDFRIFCLDHLPLR